MLVGWIYKKFGRLKTELFFIRRLIQEGFGPRYWWPYVKNKFFGVFLFQRLSRYEYVANPDFELHTICRRQDLWMLAWMLRSFLEMSGLKPVIIVHDDGTMDKQTAELLKSKFANVRIMFRDETTKRVLEMPNLPNIVKKAKVQGHFFLDKLLDILVFSKAKKIIATDTDILYYKSPTEIVDFFMDRIGCDAMVQRQIGDEITYDLKMDDFYEKKYGLNEKKIALMNGGYIIVDRDRFNINQFVEYLEHVKMPFSDYFIEMSGWACLLAQARFKFLSPERYAVKGFLNDKMVIKHYTSPRRYEMFAYGIDASRKALEKKVICGT